MIKKFLTVFVLVFIVLAVSCSEDESGNSVTEPTTSETFINFVKNRKIFLNDQYMSMYFSVDGKTFFDGSGITTGTYSFDNAESSTKATYSSSTSSVTLTLGGYSGSSYRTIQCTWSNGDYMTFQLY